MRALYTCMCVYVPVPACASLSVFMCVCVCEREREREGEMVDSTGTERGREMVDRTGTERWRGGQDRTGERGPDLRFIRTRCFRSRNPAPSDVRRLELKSVISQMMGHSFIRSRQPPPYILHGVYYLEDRGSSSDGWS